MQFLNSKAMRITGVFVGFVAAIWGFIAVSESYVRSRVPVSLSHSHAFVDLWDDGYVVLEGTWVIEGSSHAYPLNTSKIVCRAETKTCIDSMARIYMGSVPLLSVDEDAHEITRWDKETLIYQSGTKCVDYVYSISRSTKQVTGVRKMKTNVEKGFCGGMEAELKLRLANGFEVYWELEKAARPVAVNVTVALLLLAYCLFRIRRIYKEKPTGEDGRPSRS